ncbi:MAG: HAD hydrolase-like protein, partial [Phycisphaerae bacterium]
MTSPFAIIFDLDGTLVDSLSDITAALNDALEAHGFGRAEVQQVRGWVGDGVPMLCRRAAPAADEATLEFMRQTFLNAYDRCCLNTSRLYPKIREILNELHDLGVPMAVLSNKPDAFTRRIVDALCGAGLFQV